MAALASVRCVAGDRPSTSNEATASPVDRPSTSGASSNPRPRQRVNLTGELFRGALEESKQGVYKVIRYPIPGQTLCYLFEHLRTTTQGNVVYRCTGCRKSGKTVSIAVVNEYNLVGDPVHLPHICMPWRNSKERVDRMA
ncbi:hypothetical protein COOONC_03984 [Cooperia oncophora]